MKSILYADHVRINDAISIRIPTVGEVFDDEDNYFVGVSSIISTPYDMMVQLDDAGIDFSKITTFELFCLLFGPLQQMDTSLIFGDFNLSGFKTVINEKTNELVLRDEERNLVIDRALHAEISNTVQQILHVDKPVKKPGNEEGRIYMIKIARMRQRQQRRHANAKKTSQLEDLIVGLVNTGEFPYTYQTVRDMSIYQFYSSLNQIAHKIKFDNTMHGIYAGTVKIEDIPEKERSWLRQ